jgi:hypothetical protein
VGTHNSVGKASELTGPSLASHKPRIESCGGGTPNRWLAKDHGPIELLGLIRFENGAHGAGGPKGSQDAKRFDRIPVSTSLNENPL